MTGARSSFMLKLLDHLSRFTGIHLIETSAPAACRDDEVTLDIRSFRQIDTFSCGAGAGFSVVSTFHPEAEFDDFYKALRPRHGEGTSTAQLTRALKQFKIGYRLREYMSFQEITKSIDDGFPIIVGRLTEHGEDHWSVIYGYGLDPKCVFLIGRSGNPFLQAKTDWDEFRSSFRAVRGPAIQCWGR